MTNNPCREHVTINGHAHYCMRTAGHHGYHLNRDNGGYIQWVKGNA